MASEADFEAVQKIAQECGSLEFSGNGRDGPMVICALARAHERDISRAWQAVKMARKPRIHTFLATSDIHLEHKLKLTHSQCIERAREAVAYAKSLCQDVEFSPEDAGRSEVGFLVQVLNEVIAAGATTINIPDTVGYLMPHEFGHLIRELRRRVTGADTVTWSTHCHNDLGMATANALSGVMVGGARQVECTINGIGERAGNTAMEELVMVLYARAQQVPLYCGIRTEMLVPVSRMVAEMTGMLVQPNKAIVGANAFLHESGIHQDGVLKHESTYEIIRPQVVGAHLITDDSDNSCTSRLIIGKHSGRNAFRNKL